jgi:YfiH family protein
MLERIVHDNGVVTYRSARLAACGVTHGFSTRIGGVSEGLYRSLNLATLEKSDQTDYNTSVAENFRRFRRALGCEKYVRCEAKQVHGTTVWVPPAKPTKPGEAPEADALVTDHVGKLLTVRVADCVPILMSASDGSVVAAVHAGWRGLVAGVIGETLRVLEARFDVAPHDVRVAVGPAISVDHFAVDEDVAEQFIKAGLGQAVDRRFGEKPHVNLPEAALLQLIDAGVPASHVDSTDRCTYRDEDEFFSHRRDEGRTGRHAAVIAI